jgi:hypothetical protein
MWTAISIIIIEAAKTEATAKISIAGIPGLDAPGKAKGDRITGPFGKLKFKP